MKNIRIGLRLTLGFGITIAIALLIGAGSLIQTARLHARTSELASNWLIAVQDLGELRNEAQNAHRTAQGYLLSLTSADRAGKLTAHEAALHNYQNAWQKYLSTPASHVDEALTHNIEEAWRAYLPVEQRGIDTAAGGDDAFAAAREIASRTAVEKFTTLSNLIGKAVKVGAAGAAEAASEADQTYSAIVDITCALLVMALLTGVTVAIVVSRSITRPLLVAVGIAETVAKGDLTSIIHADGNDETGRLLRALERMNNQLRGMVSEIQETSARVASTAHEIADGNANLSSRTSSQAGALAQTAASMEELTATVRQNAENAVHGNVFSTQASQIAQSGGKVVSRVMETMQAISDHSNRVSEIIGVIEGIAFQTNILALNAAVEAARAGEHGRGFAVVAGEVRALALRSAGAAKETKDLIGQSVSGIQQGRALAEEAGTTIATVVTSVDDVKRLMGEIASATAEQQTGIEQVNRAVAQMDALTQNNGVLVKAATTSASAMSEQSRKLKSVVEIFRV